MAVRVYTREQLVALRESSLVLKPDNLPAIEQWIDEAATTATSTRTAVDPTRRQQQQRNGVSLGGSSDNASPMGSFSTGRPPLGTRNSTLRGQNGEGLTLGPPSTIFASSRNTHKASDSADKTGTDGTTENDGETSRSKFFNRRSLNEKEGGRDPRDSWTTVRERRQRGEEGEDRGFGSRDHDSERNGYGERERPQRDPRWTREDRWQNGDRPAPGGWREREAARRQRDDHDREPEWMEDPVVKQDQELGFGVARNQDEFQKWKESMNKKTKGEDTSAEVVEEPAPPPPVPEPKAKVAPLKLDGFENGMLGWGNNPATTGGASVSSPATAGPKPAAKSGKASRFASMFKPAEPEPPVETPAPEATNGLAKTTAEDQEGFNRVLQMLGGVKIGQPATAPVPQQQAPTPAADTASPPPLKTMTSNGTIKKSRFANMFEQKSPERLQSPQQPNGPFMGGDSVFDGSNRGFQEEMHQLPHQQLFGGRLPERQQPERQQPQPQPSRMQAPESTMSPDPSSANLFNALREQQPRPASGRHEGLSSIFDPPSRGAASPDVNIQNLLAQQRQQPQINANQGRQELLSLLTGNSSRPQSGQALPNNVNNIDQAQLARWLQQQHSQGQPMPEPHAPKPRLPQQQPGHYEERIMRDFPQDVQEPQRRSQRAPPGFGGDEYLQQQQFQQHQAQAQAEQQARIRAAQQQQQQQIMAQHQQHQPQRRISAHPNLPHMQIPGQPPQPDFQQITSPMSASGPPGFHATRHPPGFQQHISPYQQQRDGPPPGFGGLQSPPGAEPPPGFYGGGGAPPMPPGFQMNQMRSPTEQRPRGYDGFPEGMIPSRR